MFKFKIVAAVAAMTINPVAYAVSSQAYTWKNVKIGGGGGFVPGIVFNPTEKVCGFTFFASVSKTFLYL